MSSLSLDKDHVLSYSATSAHASVIFLHGIMGSKKNLQTFIRRFEQETGYDAIAFDLRNHGESSKHWSPFTVASAASDIVTASNLLGLKPRAIIGHSFGGKVALLAAASLKSLEQIWLLDSSPKRVDASDTLAIIEILDSLAWPFASRTEVVEKLLAEGVEKNIALWMTTNLVTKADGLHLVFSPQEMKAMLIDFLNLDGWPLIPALAESMHIHLVAAERGARVTGEEGAALMKSALHQGHFHVLKGAGHFVHADNPEGLLDIMKPYFTHG